MAWPASPPDWLLPWVIWRFRGTGTKPTGAPKEVPKWAWAFLKWCAWRRKGAIPPRPDGLPTRIPAWGWQILKMLSQALPVEPPPPPPPPPPPTPASSWHLRNPLMFVAWATKLDWTTSESMSAAAQKMGEAGVGTVALQIGQASPWQAQIIRSYGPQIALWGVASSEDARALDEFDAEGYMPQIEGLHEYEPAIESLSNGVGAGLSISTVTTFAGLEQPDQMNALIATGCTHGWIECYAQTGGNRGDVPVMMNQADIYGFPHADPVIATYWDVPIANYNLAAHGRQIGAWSAEYFDAADYAALKAL